MRDSCAARQGQDAGVAQLAERLTRNEQVRGSIPRAGLLLHLDSCHAWQSRTVPVHLNWGVAAGPGAAQGALVRWRTRQLLYVALLFPFILALMIGIAAHLAVVFERGRLSGVPDDRNADSKSQPEEPKVFLGRL